MSETIILPREQWPLVEPVVTGIFGNAMPAEPSQAEFLAAMDGEKVKGFVHIERLFHFNCVYTAPEFRGSGLAMDLIREATARIPGGYSAVWLTDRNATQIAALLDWRQIGLLRVYRKDA